MIRFNSRGHEVVSSIPHEPSVRLNQAPRDTIEDRIRRMVMHRQMEENDAIRDEADLMEDLQDFSDDEFDANLFGDSRYEVADDVPDAFSAKDYRASKKAKKTDEIKDDSPKPGSSAPEPSGLAGE